MANAWGHLKTISKHKALVTSLCFKVGLPRQGLLHDLSKYSPTEFMTGARYWQGMRSPNAAEREDLGYSVAWLHHKGRNKHHFEYWIDLDTDNFTSFEGKPMPTRFVVEMFCDRVAACKVYQGSDYTDRSPLEYFQRGRDTRFIHPDSQALLEGMLEYLAAYGEEEALRAIREQIVLPRYAFGERGRF